MSKDSYMLEHEAFVSNIKGTSVGCVLVCLLHLPMFILLTKLFQGKRKPRIIRDLVFLVLPILATITVLAEYNYWSLLSAICISVLFMNSSDLTYDLNRDHVLVGDSNSPTSSSHAIIYYSTSYITLFKGKIDYLPKSATIHTSYKYNNFEYEIIIISSLSNLTHYIHATILH